MVTINTSLIVGGKWSFLDLGSCLIHSFIFLAFDLPFGTFFFHVPYVVITFNHSHFKLFTLLGPFLLS